MTDLISLALPFIFSFIIVYGALEFTGTFSRRVSSIIAIVVALFTMSVPQVSAFINSVLPYAVILFVAFFFIGLVVTFFRKIKPAGGGGAKERRLELWIIIFGLILLILATQTEFFESIFPGSKDMLDTILIGIGILVILTLLYWAFSSKGKE